MMNKRKIGLIKEGIACNYLTSIGYRIIDRNYYTRMGELDIVAKDEDTVCFIEVKYVKENNVWIAAEAVKGRKIKNIKSTAKAYVLEKKLNPNDKYRFDVVSIDGDKITLYKGAI